jgi:hypothetical protein
MLTAAQGSNNMDLNPGQDTGNPPAGGSDTGEICIPNISPRERRKRLAGGVIQFLFSLVVFAVLIAVGVDRWWRLILLPMFWGAAVGFFQWRDKT